MTETARIADVVPARRELGGEDRDVYEPRAAAPADQVGRRARCRVPSRLGDHPGPCKEDGRVPCTMASARDIMNEIRVHDAPSMRTGPGIDMAAREVPAGGRRCRPFPFVGCDQQEGSDRRRAPPVLVRHDDHALEGNRDHTAQLLSPPLPRRGEEVKVRVNLRSGRG